MRFALLALALALSAVACSADPSCHDSACVAPADVVTVADAILDTSAPDVTPDAPGDASVDAAPDATPDAAPDVAADVAQDAPRDAVDAADPCGASNLRTCDVNGHNECVNIESGRVLGGVVVHCGACGVTCAMGEVCAERRCQRL